MLDNKPYLLCTQPLDSALIDKAAGKGLIIHCLSFIEVKPIGHPELKNMIGRLSESSITAVFTSLHAVEIVLAYLDGRKPDWRIFCTGPTTRESVAAYFGNDRIAGDGSSASAVADAILVRKEITDIVFFCGRQRRNELPEKLSRQGIIVQEVPVYDSLPNPQKISWPYDAISFFSPGAVQSFFSVNHIGHEIILFAIGKTTGDAIAAYCSNEIILSLSPGKEILIEQAIEYFQKKTIQHPGY